MTYNTTARAVIEGVPRIQFYSGGVRCPEDLCFPSALRAWVEYVNDKDYGCKHCIARTPACKVNCTYSFLIGVSGMASLMSWGPDWSGGNMAIERMSDDPIAPFQRAFDAVGYRFEWVTRLDNRDSESVFRQRIMQSIDAGRPVIGFGVVGPPEAALITGYDDHGDTLIGWSFFQDGPDFSADVTFEPSGYFRKRKWFKDTSALAITGEKVSQPDMRKVIREALQWMLQVSRTPAVENGARANGLAAYHAWADALLNDEWYPAGNIALLQERHWKHNDLVGVIAEARWYGAQFLFQCVDFVHYSMVEDLMHAAACYAGEHDLMWQAWNVLGGNGHPEAHLKFALPAARRQLAQIAQQSRDKYALAAMHIEHALGLPVT
jgi:hypothetical protein